MKPADYRKINDRTNKGRCVNVSLASSTHRKNDPTAVRAKLKENSRREVAESI